LAIITLAVPLPFFNSHHVKKLALVTGNAPVTDQVLQKAKKGNRQMPVTDKAYS
jgi:hypothetical protein